MDYSKIRKYRRLLKARRQALRGARRLGNHMRWMKPVVKIMAWMLSWLNPRRYISLLDWYIIKKFIGTYVFSILLIISIAIVFDFNENLSKFTQYHAPWRAIIFDYYANFIPYYSNLFSPLFVFIAVIYFTSKLAGNSEIIAMMATGMSFRRLLRPYMFSCVLIALTTFYLNAYVIPHGTVIRQQFENRYRRNKVTNAADNVQIRLSKSTVVYMQHYDDQIKRGYGFSLDKFEGKKLVSHMTASDIQYDTIAESKYHWTANNWKVRTLRGLREKIQMGAVKDTVIPMEPADLIYSKGQQETFTSPELKRYISKQTSRGAANVKQYEVEYHKRIAMSFASFILTIIGASLSARKRKGGMGLYLGVGFALSFAYIMLQTVSSAFAVQANMPPPLAAWTPNIIFAVIALFCYRQAPN
ncbi:membrane protein [Prevotella lacticifex]|uniref:Membrane protein n=3 Tax=Prevotella TaxID=838 RepID=A0A9R1C722_9BACT|nr:membrane protein [Prevotella lacticifex]GJG40543.1 membrane protein [Prevotella lacticifex]GJG44239.1 membrane protein [Prevotella lacticifex]GJG46925.1 membrane protein [Prevotella lacticifex]GJG50454.1 membrane protein [Prevotella lacticifex]